MKLSRCFLASLSGLWISSTATVAAAGCCTNDWKSCNYPWQDTEAKCLEVYSSDTTKPLVWLPNGALSDCVERWASSCEDDSDCCAGLFCQKTPGWNSCQVPEGYTFAATTTTTTADADADANTAPALSVGDCPFIELNFTDVENGAHGYYGQTPILQKGDYLFDQLWYSHGVKVSARVRKLGHRGSNKAIFIPLYDRTTKTWNDMKQLTHPNNVTSGGAVRLLDTLHPMNDDTGYGDPDLGAPNENCENIESTNKPGKCGTKRCGGGTYTQEQVGGEWKDTDTVNPYANCKELGLVCIIEENGRTDPDDTALGGFITFTFREPIDLELTSLLDIDDGTVPYIVLTYSDGQKSEKVHTKVTHENGFFPLTGDLWPEEVKTSDVIMVDVRYQSSGSLNSMVYQYCPKTPTAVIEIIKYAGPPGKCSEGMTRYLFDDTYLATIGNNFVYCYEISYPIVANADQEFLYDVKMEDPAPGGIISYDLTDPDELFRPGDKIYIEGQTHQVQLGGEASYDAYVEGFGKFTGVKVTDTDPARVVAHSILTTSEEPWCDTKFNMYECWEVANLGPDTSSSDYLSEFGRLKGREVNLPEGYESRIAFLVGGSYVAVKAAEIEGKAVVLGNFIIEASGTNSIGHAGVGSGIFPKTPSAHLQVGGDLDGGKTDGETWFMGGASVEYGGSCISDPRNARNVTAAAAGWVYPDTMACGTMFVPTTAVDGVEPSISQVLMDKTPYEKLFLDLQHKSKYWYSLKPNGEIVLVGTNTRTMTLKVAEGDTNCLQVFLMEHHHLQGLTEIRIDPSLNGKTILINVSPFDADGNVNGVVINGIHSVFDTDNVRDYTSTAGFSPKIKRAMLWNFYGAPDVTLGPDGGLQMPGSILIPHGNLNFHWPGQDGRTIVYGNVVHDGVGSEFHNYEFDPPCDLPLPPDTVMPDQCIIPITDCGNICYGNGMKLIKDEATIPLPPGAISYANGLEDSVDFKITQLWKSDDAVSHIIPFYDDECGTKVEGFNPNAVITSTAQCENGVATVRAYVKDGSFQNNVSNDPPEECDTNNGWQKSQVAYYELELPCNGQNLCGGSDPTPAPVTPVPSTYQTMAPTDCVYSIDESSTCEGVSMVSTIKIRGDVLPYMPPGSDLIYNFTKQGPVDARTIKFNVDNPFDFPVDIYVQYNKQVGSTSAGDPVCAERFDTPGCDEDAAVIEAVCLYPSTMSGTPFVWIQVYFVSNHTTFGNAANTVSDLYDCCDQKEGTMNDPIVQYTLKIDCGCPTVVTDAH